MNKSSGRKSPETHALSLSKLRDLPPSPASGSKTMFWDIKVTGLGAFRTSRDHVSFVVQYRGPVDGVTRRKTLGRLGQLTIEQARSLAADYAHDVRRGIDPIMERRRKAAEERNRHELIFANYVDAYLERRKAKDKPHSDREVGIIRNDLVRLLGEKRIDCLTVREVEDFADELGLRSPSARRMGIVHLKTILNDAKRRNMIDRSPADAVETPKSGERSRRLTDWEIQRFMEAADDLGGPRGAINVVLMRTMKRKQEVSDMPWEELNVAEGLWLLPAARSKDGLDHLIKLPKQVMAIILAQQPDARLRRGPVFTLDGRTAPEMGSQVKDILDASLQRRVELANQRDGASRTVAHYTIHDIRTSGASRCQEKPLSLPSDMIDHMLLHAVGSSVTRIYQRAALVEEVGEALQKWNDWLDGLMSGQDAWPGADPCPPLSVDRSRNSPPSCAPDGPSGPIRREPGRSGKAKPMAQARHADAAAATDRGSRRRSRVKSRSRAG